MKTNIRNTFGFGMGLLLASTAMAGQALEQAERMLANAQAQLQMAKSANPLALKEISPGCVQTPLPTAITGPSVAFEVATGSAQTVRVVAWRRPCSANDGQLLLTFTPIIGTPFICGSAMKIRIGGLETDDLFLDANPNDGVGTSFCGNLTATTTFVIHEFDNAVVFDDDFAFTLIYESDFGPDASVLVPAYDSTQYGSGTGLLPIAGKHSGSYYIPARNGEGVLLEIGRIGTRKVLFVTWYTYYLGQQRWIFGNVDFAAGATSATVPMFITTGGQFGAAFQPSQVMIAPWGQATVSFPSCSSMRLQWAEAGGQTGSYLYERPLDGLEGISCP